MTDEALAERMKSLFHEVEDGDRTCMAVSVTYRTSADSWRTVTVRDPGLFDEAPDGFAVVTEDGGL